MSASDTFGEASPQRQRLGRALRELRQQGGLSGQQLAELIGISQSKVSRIEHGQLIPPIGDVQRWATQTRASSEQRTELLELAETVATEAIAWRRRIKHGLVALQQETAELEASAGVIHLFHPMLVPGLLQTPGYAKAVYQAAHPDGRPDIAEAVAARMNRQAILYAEGKRFEFVLTEGGLRWRFGSAALLLAQLDRLAMVLTLPNVSLGIIPLAAEVPVWHSHGFTIFAERDGGPVVHIETLTSALNVRNPNDVAAYQGAFARLQVAAVAGGAARALLEQLAAEVRAAASQA